MGAGLSGIGMACHLALECPGTTFAILEGRDAIGGTWDLFRYPGVRSDSDMYTLGYSFRPWPGPTSIADGQAILDYITDTADEFGVTDRIRLNHAVTGAAWSSADARWTVTVRRGDTGEVSTVTCRFLYLACGYYRYDAGHTPEFPCRDRFTGPVVHPQQWPDDLDYAGRRVAVIGSGATAVTLVPALAERAAHVTMVQRTPTYIAALPSRDRVADVLRRRLSPERAYAAIRRKNIALSWLNYRLSRTSPAVMKALLRRGVQKALPPGYDVDTDFAPPYEPWDQRLCLAPDGDFFAAIAAGRAEVVTGRIASFTDTGLRMESGREVPADIIVTATGLDLLVIGGIALTVDGKPIDPAATVGYKGMMLSDVPNLAVAIGYTNASWTLKCDLICEYVCRMLRFMDARGYREARPMRPDPQLPTRPFLDLDAGYIRRALDTLPKQVDEDPWRLHQNYYKDRRLFRDSPLQDAGMRFT